MIREINIKAVEQVAEQVTAAKRVLGVFPETPLSQLASLSLPAFEVTESTPYVDVLRGVVNQADVAEQHGDVLDIGVAAIAGSVKKQMRFARETVVPAVSKIINDIRNTIGEREPSPWQIQQIDFSELVESESIRSLVDKWAGDVEILQQVSVGFPVVTEEATLISQLETGSASVNQKLMDLVATKPTGWVLEVYNNFFRGEGGKYSYDNMRRKCHQPTAASKTRLGDTDAYAIALVLAMNLADADPLEGANMSLADYQRRLSDVQNAAASLLSACYRQYDKFTANEIMVINSGMGDASSVISVFGPIYRKFLENYTAEVIIGYALMSPSSFRISVVEVSEKANIALARYKRWLNAFEETRDDRLKEQIPRLLIKHTSDYIRALPDSDNLCGLTQDQMIDKLVGLTSECDGDYWVSELYPTCRAVIIKAIWPDCAALGILESIDQLSEDLGDDTDVRLLAYHAIRRLVVAHVGSMLTLDMTRS